MKIFSQFLKTVFGKNSGRADNTPEVSIPLGKLESIVCHVTSRKDENENPSEACSRKWQAIADTIAKTSMHDADRDNYRKLIQNLESIAEKIKAGTNEHHAGVWINREIVKQIHTSIPLIAEALDNYAHQNTQIQNNACYEGNVVGIFTRQPVRMVFEEVAIPRNILPIALTTFIRQFESLHHEMNIGKGFDYGVNHIPPEQQKKGLPGRPHGMSR